MKKHMSFKGFKKIVEESVALGKNVVAVSMALPADHHTPLTVYKILSGSKIPSALLESVRQGKDVGRYSIVAARPFLRFSINENISTEMAIDGCNVAVKSNNPLKHMADVLVRHTPLYKTEYFNGGAIGYVGYEAAKLVEPTILRNVVDDLGCPDVLFLFFHQIVVFDNAFQTMRLVINERIDLKKSIKALYESVIRKLDRLEKLVIGKCIGYKKIRMNVKDEPIISNVTEKDFMGMVEKAKEYIESGDVFQVVLSQRFQRSFPEGASLDFYRLLRGINPSPYLFHINFGDGFKMVGASPEVMVEIKNQTLHIRPIAGTRKKGKTSEEDAALAQDLREDEKEKAEHKMLVDLARNDVGRYSEFGSIAIPELMKIENYSHVMHMVTSVYGRLRKNISPLEACLGCLPAGTLSGAPKIKAMEIIANIEPAIRGPYGGAVGVFTEEKMDTAIPIRFALIKNGQIYWQTGAGIVHDSDPKKEYEETLAKAKAIEKTLQMMTRRH